MAERTQRGKQDRKTEDDEMTGEPVATETPDDADRPAANMTRDKGVTPAKDD